MLSTFNLRSLFLLGILCSTFTLFGQSTPNPLITEIQFINSDSLYRHLYLYNKNARKTLETSYVMRNERWQRREQKEWIYDSDNGKVCLNEFFRAWRDGEWTLTREIKHAYTAENKPATETHIVYENGTSFPVSRHSWFYNGQQIVSETDSAYVDYAWQALSKTDYLYDAAAPDRLDSVVFTQYSNGAPSAKSKLNFSYNAAWQLHKQTYAEMNADNWLNDFQTETYYQKTSGKKIYQIKKVWSEDMKKWVNSENITYTYDSADNLKTETYQRWNELFWVNDLRYEYFYDANNKLTKKISHLPIYNDFRPVKSINYSNFEYGKASLIEAKYEFWGGETGNLTNAFIPHQFNEESIIKYGSKIKISYIPVNETGITTMNDSIKKGEIEIYPNPSTAIFYFDARKYRVKSWTVHDITGKIIKAQAHSENSGVIDLGDYKSGIYILKVMTDESMLSQKLIKK